MADLGKVRVVPPSPVFKCVKCGWALEPINGLLLHQAVMSECEDAGKVFRNPLGDESYVLAATEVDING